MRVLAGTNDGIYRVAGGEMRRVSESDVVHELVRLGKRVFAGTGSGLLMSDSNGDDWVSSGLRDREVWQVRGAVDGILYASTQPTGLFRSNDGGNTWCEIESLVRAPEADYWCLPLTPPKPARARALVVDPNDSNRIWVGIEVGGIMRTYDGGATWNLHLPGDNPDIHMLFPDPARQHVMYATMGYGRLHGEADRIEGNAGVFRSSDCGSSWHYAWAGITPRYSRPMCVDPRAPHAITVGSAPSAFSSCSDYGGARAALFRSEDGGSIWRSLCDRAHSPSAANIHGLTHDPGILGGVILGTDTGEVWRVSNEAEWTVLAVGASTVRSILAV